MSRAEQQRRRKHRKECRGRERRENTAPTARLPADGPRIIQLYEYTITDEPIILPEEVDPELDTALKDIRIGLHDEVGNDPKSAIPKLVELLNRFPRSRVLMNWLTMAYQRVGEKEEVKRLVKLSYELHPEYLFSRTNYASLLLHEGKAEEAADVMEHKWDLKAMYPYRDVFHESEFISFCQVAFRYFVVTGETEQARSLYNLLQQWGPDYPLTSHMKKVLEGSRASTRGRSLTTP
jgi:hypothetical protein